jgi:tetratricopeptide (TPR) repeat protein
MAGPGDDAFNEAEGLRNQGDLQGAMAAAHRGLAVEPDNYRLNNLIGGIFASQGQYDSSLAYYNAAVQKKGKDPDALFGAGMAALNLKSYDEALELFKRGEKSGKDKAKFLYGQGLVQLEKGDYSNADISFRKAIDKDKKNARYHLALAEANYRNKTYPIALNEFNRAIEMDSSLYQRGDIHYKMAQAHLNMRNINAAIEEYKFDLQVNSADTNGWMELGKIYLIADRKPEAVYSYEKYLELRPSDGKAWFDLAGLYLQIKDQEKAAQAFEKTVELDYNTAQSYGQLATIYSERKEYERALDAYNRYEKAFGAPDSVQYWFEKGKVMMKLGEKNAMFFDSAMTAFVRATQIDPTFTQGYEYAGLTMYYQKDYQKAIDFFNRLIAQDPQNVNAYRNLAFAYLKTNDYPNTTRTLRRLLELKSDDVISRAMLARIYSFRENFDSAAEQYEIILNGSNGQVTDSLRCEIYPDLGFDYLKLNKCDKAIPVLLKADHCKPKDSVILMNIAASYQLCNNLKDAKVYYKKVLEVDPDNKIAKKGLMEVTVQGED